MMVKRQPQTIYPHKITGSMPDNQPGMGDTKMQEFKDLPERVAKRLNWLLDHELEAPDLYGPIITKISNYWGI